MVVRYWSEVRCDGCGTQVALLAHQLPPGWIRLNGQVDATDVSSRVAFSFDACSASCMTHRVAMLLDGDENAEPS